VLLLTSAAALSGCGSNGVLVRPAICPIPPIPPASLMQPPETGKKVRDELFEPQTNATPK